MKKMANVFIATCVSGLSDAVRKILPSTSITSINRINKDAGPGITHEEVAAIEKHADILLADVPVIQAVAHSAQKLKWAASTWAGVEGLVKFIKDTKTPSFTVTRMGGAFNTLMCEYVLANILARERHVLELAKQQEAATWDKVPYMKYRSLSELTVCILGLGEIGTAVASLCGKLGMKVIGVTRNPVADDRKCPEVTQYSLVTDLSEVLAVSDYVVSILPSTPQSRGLLSADMFSHCKNKVCYTGDMFSHCKNKKTVFINIGRGDVVDEESIVKAINNGWLGGAVLDVFDQEPLPPTSRLWSLPGVIVTPHLAGPSTANQ
ncbi:hypothetical protein DPMN_179225, partial [Dreissena polymorpha]